MSFRRQASGGLGMEWVSCLHFDLSLAMAIHSAKSFELPLLLSAFSNVLHKSSVDNQSVENAIPNQSVTAVAPGSWVYLRRGQPNEESDYESNCRCQECPSDGKDSRKWYGERFVHSSITVGVRANIIPFKMIRTLNSTQQSPRTARDLLHFLSRPYPASFAFNLVLFRFFYSTYFWFLPSLSLLYISSSFRFPPSFTCHVNLTLINMRFNHVLLLLPISHTHYDFLDLSTSCLSFLPSILPLLNSQNFWRSHHVRVVVLCSIVVTNLHLQMYR